jgi:hypothetical protein
VAARLPEPIVQQSSAVDLALSGHNEALLQDWELAMVTTAKQPDANPGYVLQTVPGMGKIRSLVRWYERPASARCPRVQDVVSYGRVGKCAKASAGKRSGTSGTKSGPADRTWAFAAAAVRFLRHNPAGPQ